MNKFLIVGLGNPGSEYDNTRHNIGFKVLDAFADSLKVKFNSSRLADIAEGKVKNKIYLLIKPTTFMNLSGKAVNYYLQQQKIPLSNLLVVTDDIALATGTIRLRPKGSDGGHNGLKSIQIHIGSIHYARLRFGIGNNFPKGAQVNYVLSPWSAEEARLLPELIKQAAEQVKSFVTAGLELTMTRFNKKP